MIATDPSLEQTVQSSRLSILFRGIIRLGSAFIFLP